MRLWGDHLRSHSVQWRGGYQLAWITAGVSVLGFNLSAMNDEYLGIHCIKWGDDKRNLLPVLKLFEQDIMILTMQPTTASL